MTRILNGFYAPSAVAVCMVLTTAWFLTSRRFSDIVPLAPNPFQVANTFDQRLVVFGDSWSDNQSNPPQGKIWTDWLCSMTTGAVVDNKELNLLDRLSQTHPTDFKSQLQQWLDAETAATKDLSAEAVRSRQDRTIFVVLFGVWDLWRLVTKDYDAASKSVKRRIATLMDQLDMLSERLSTTGLRVILTQTVDVTFLGFKAGGQDKDTVRILEE
ncbi:Esterase SGNH hydrolase-type [Penicillium chrysogenum]|uniref:Esterase SGNH hydrolase-type n=1 Tax=Penicillium chrysogenum TaxID=5076 RepID=A0ABQ8WD92_PENCH|nr:Esterase SGNH hydrolase-type [Penicillium chrysogenum]